jgi:hypothetical protein
MGMPWSLGFHQSHGSRSAHGRLVMLHSLRSLRTDSNEAATVGFEWRGQIEFSGKEGGDRSWRGEQQLYHISH